MRQLSVKGVMENADMNKIVIGALGVIGLTAVAAAGVLQAGLIDVAADTPHHPAVHRLIEWARERAIVRRAADIQPPVDLADPARVRRGAGNYDAMCAGCHLAPGVEDSEIRKGLNPQPPKLAEPTADSPGRDARRFWITKHGIKASGMPAWSKGGMDDAAIWDLIAFIDTLPRLSPQEYRRQVEASPGHAHAGRDGHAAGHETAPAVEQPAPSPSPKAAHDHGSHAH